MNCNANYSYSEFNELVNKSEQTPLVITNDTISYGEKIYPVENIADIKVLKKVVNESPVNIFTNLSALILIIGFFVLFGSFIIGVLLIIVGFILGALTMSDDIPHEFYGLGLETYYGTHHVFYNKDQSFIEDIQDMIIKMIEGDKPLNYTVHIGDKKFVDNNAA